VLAQALLAFCLGTPGALAEDAPHVLDASAATVPDVVAPGGESRLTVTVRLTPGWHVNAHRPSEPYLIPTTLEVTPPPEVEVGDVTYPPGEERAFAFNPKKPLATYEGTFEVTAALRVTKEASVDRATLVRATLRYQACNDTRCLPPRTVDVMAQLQLRRDAGAAADDGDGGRARAGTTAGAATGFGAAWIQDGGLSAYAAAFAIGLLLNLTPCVYPLIAVTVAYFGGQGRGSRARVVGLAAAYVAGIAITFSTLGTVSAMSGAAFGMALQHPGVLVFIAATLLALAASNFGLYQLRVPAALGRWAGKSSGGAGGAVFMGLTMGLIAAPCVGPVLAGLLLVVGARQDAVFGATLFFVLSLGLGAPYVVLAAVADAARRLPRSGGWLAWMERVLGFVLVGLALFYVEPLMPAAARTVAWVGLLGIAGLYLGFLDRTVGSVGFLRMKRGVAVAGLLAAVAVASWNEGTTAESAPIPWEPLTPTALGTARANGMPAVVDFTAQWCLPCREMDATTFHDSKVIGQARKFVMFRADVTVADDQTDALMRAHRVLGVPTYLFFTATGEEAARLVGFVPAEEFLRAMEEAAAG
jgi:thiol:disulfide interchange protein DsbD